MAYRRYIALFRVVVGKHSLPHGARNEWIRITAEEVRADQGIEQIPILKASDLRQLEG